jgi:hypothetical protein
MSTASQSRKERLEKLKALRDVQNATGNACISTVWESGLDGLLCGFKRSGLRRDI